MALIYGDLGYDMNGRKRKRKYLKKTRKATIRNFEPVKVKENPVLTQAEEHRQKYPSYTGPVSHNSCAKKESMKYTGTYVKGIATMHKSNAVPIVSKEHATDIARMRRG